jgi:hypothetical protein
MPDQRPPRADAGPASTSPATAEAAQPADSRARLIAIAAVVIALVGLGIAAWHAFVPASSCQTTAWDAIPAASDLPEGWTVGATQYDRDRMSTTLLGPQPQDTSAQQAIVYATVTCYVSDASGAVSRSEQAAADAGQSVASRTDLGDEGFTALDPSGATFIQFRARDVVAYVAASGDATADEVEAVASAFDRALDGNGSSVAPATLAPPGGPSPAPSSVPSVEASAVPSASAEPSASAAAAAPELEAALPTDVGGTPLTVDSAIGSTVLGEDAGSRATVAALRAAGHSVDDFQVAEAYDPTGTLDLSIIAFRVEGMTSAALETLIRDTWLSAGGTGVATSDVTLAGKPFTRIDYGDGGSMSYYTAVGDIVIVIETATPDLAAEAAAALP